MLFHIKPRVLFNKRHPAPRSRVSTRAFTSCCSAFTSTQISGRNCGSAQQALEGQHPTRVSHWGVRGPLCEGRGRGRSPEALGSNKRRSLWSTLRVRLLRLLIAERCEISYFRGHVVKRCMVRVYILYQVPVQGTYMSQTDVSIHSKSCSSYP